MTFACSTAVREVYLPARVANAKQAVKKVGPLVRFSQRPAKRAFMGVR